MCDPVPEDPQDAEVAGIYMRNRAEYDRIAREWTLTHARSEMAKKDHPSVQKICDMGFDRTQVMQALQRNQMNEERAIEELLSSM
jgi:ubiquitin-conjugating enzyme (huntingtin interacting protein 2)